MVVTMVAIMVIMVAMGIDMEFTVVSIMESMVMVMETTVQVTVKKSLPHNTTAIVEAMDTGTDKEAMGTRMGIVATAKA